jgi:hypothetical protein
MWIWTCFGFLVSSLSLSSFDLRRWQSCRLAADLRFVAVVEDSGWTDHVGSGRVRDGIMASPFALS